MLSLSLSLSSLSLTPYYTRIVECKFHCAWCHTAESGILNTAHIHNLTTNSGKY